MDLCGIRTRIAGVEGKRSDHLTTTTAPMVTMISTKIASYNTYLTEELKFGFITDNQQEHCEDICQIFTNLAKFKKSLAIFSVFLVCVKNLNLIWQIFHPVGQIFNFVNGQILNFILSSSLTDLDQ